MRVCLGDFCSCEKLLLVHLVSIFVVAECSRVVDNPVDYDGCSSELRKPIKYYSHVNTIIMRRLFVSPEDRSSKESKGSTQTCRLECWRCEQSR